MGAARLEVRREVRAEKKKALVFQPDIQKSTASINKMQAGLSQKPAIQEMKGV